MNLIEIEDLARKYAAARAQAEERTAELQGEIARLKRQRMEAIKTAIERTAQAHTELYHAVAISPELFAHPKTALLAGVIVGFRKEQDHLEWENDDQVVAAIEKLLPEKYQILVKVTRVPVPKALKLLPVAVLDSLGISRDVGMDEVFIKAGASDIDKFVERLVREAEEEPAPAGRAR